MDIDILQDVIIAVFDNIQHNTHIPIVDCMLLYIANYKLQLERGEERRGKEESHR